MYRWDGGNDAPDGWFEAHVEHAIDFVEDQDLNLVELHQSAPDKVFQTAWSRDNQPCAAADVIQLWSLGHATDDQRGGETDQLCAGLLHLHRELAGGQQDQCAGNLCLRFLQLLDDGNEEAECLAGAGLRCRQDIPALECGRNCAYLYGCEGNKIGFGETLLEVRRNR